MEWIQIIILIFCLFALSRAALRLKDKQISNREFIFWLIIWVIVIGFAFMPWIMSYLASFLGISRGVDLFVYLAIILLFYIVFKIYVKLDTIEQEITKLVRKDAIKKVKKR